MKYQSKQRCRCTEVCCNQPCVALAWIEIHLKKHGNDGNIFVVVRKLKRAADFHFRQKILKKIWQGMAKRATSTKRSVQWRTSHGFEMQGGGVEWNMGEMVKWSCFLFLAWCICYYWKFVLLLFVICYLLLFVIILRPCDGGELAYFHSGYLLLLFC